MQTSNWQGLKICSPFFLFYFLLTWYVSDHAFFWDTIQLGSRHAHWYFDTNFQHLLLPKEFDSGHIPTFGMYLAAVWKCLGRSLAVSHWAMFPFLLGIVYQAYRLAKYIFPIHYVPYLMILLLLDPTLLAQSSLISPDIILVFFFLLGVNAVFYNQAPLKVIASIGLALISMRGMMLVLGLFLFDLFLHTERKTIKNLIQRAFKNIWVYVPSGLLAMAYLGYHYSQTGWFAYHADSPWAPAFEKVGIGGFFKNIVLLGWRLVDFGRLIIWVYLAVNVFFFVKHKRKLDPKLKSLLLLIGILFLVLTPSMLLHQGILNPRYLLPIFLMINVLTVYILYTTFYFNRTLIFSLLVAALVAGNFLVYPPSIAQGWDASLSYLPFVELRKKMNQYIKDEGIPVESVGTVFPNYYSFRLTDLTEDKRQYAHKDLSNQLYIFDSNIFNDFTDEERATLIKGWELIQAFEQRNIYVHLYKKK